MRSLALVFLVLATGLVRAAPAVDLSWLSGDWRRCRESEIVEERWLGPRGDLMVGVNHTSSKTRATFEHLRIDRVDDTWTYWASPTGRTPVPFRLIESAPGRAVFANAEHVFPARIVYQREGDELVARIEGTVRDQPAAVEWHFDRGVATDCAHAP